MGMTAGTRPSRRRPGRRPGRLALLGGIALSLGLAGIAAAWVKAPGLDDGHAEIRMRYSAFTTTEVVATAGVPFTFVLVNADPIDHEWLVGDDAFHERHRTGTEPSHGTRPTEVSVPAGTTRDDHRHVPGPRGVPLHLPPARPRGLRHGRHGPSPARSLIASPSGRSGPSPNPTPPLMHKMSPPTRHLLSDAPQRHQPCVADAGKARCAAGPGRDRGGPGADRAGRGSGGPGRIGRPRQVRRHPQ